MKTIEIMPMGTVVDCMTGASLANDTLVKRLQLPMACGGQGLCATCHVVVLKGAENLTPRSELEERALNRISGVHPNSRLSCQAKVRGDVTVAVPDGVYLENPQQFSALLGRRSEVNILHPVDGRILVGKGQIISKTAIRQLESISFSNWDKVAGNSRGTDGKAV